MQLTPSILGNAQKYIKEKKALSNDKPVFFVFHGACVSTYAARSHTCHVYLLACTPAVWFALAHSCGCWAT